ncbi:MAG: hypothetical protein ACK5XO_13400, partial [Phycisphaerales bacterium]
RKLPPLTHSSRLLQALRPYEHTPNQVPIASDRTLAHGKVCSGDGDSNVTQLARCVIMSKPDARGMHGEAERNRPWSASDSITRRHEGEHRQDEQQTECGDPVHQRSSGHRGCAKLRLFGTVVTDTVCTHYRESDIGRGHGTGHHL